ncbi:MAG: 4-hydroxythreonine-4-phosphate dehydrogenase PdxA [Gammaproteobacteria bacterium]
MSVIGKLPKIVLTSGEPAGVGPELCLEIARQPLACELVCLGDHELLAERARLTRSKVELRDYDPKRPQPHAVGTLRVLHVPCAVPSRPGELDARNARYVLALIDRAIDGCRGGEFDAMVTAPVQKSVINDAGIAFTGHTEYLAARTQAPLPVMLLVAGTLRVALATTHLPLKDVSRALSVEKLIDIVGVLDRGLKSAWRMNAPRIAACGLNPHAGESGHLGDEELRIIGPALESCRAQGVKIDGPLPADTVFVPKTLERYDAVLAMYHDQGLPVLKHAGFGHSVNVTLGLPIVRTSVDHGTALDLAGTGRADAGSLAAAIALALEITRK